MKLIVGLGNSDRKYLETRHNIGRRLVEFAARARHVKFSRKKQFQASVAETAWDGQDAVLAYPEAYMNVSGPAVRLLAGHYGIHPETDLLVVVDDFALAFGQWRIRERGSDGGHNGLKSVEEALGTADYSRLRCGVGTPEGDVRDYVLSRFSGEQQKKLEAVLTAGMEACRLWLTQPMPLVMNAVNSKPQES